jgi:hypothetical protein
MKYQTFINFSFILTCILLICAYATPNDDHGYPESLPSAGATFGDVEENLVRLIASKLEDKESLQNVRLTCRQFKQATSITKFQRALYEEIHEQLKDCTPSGPLKSTLDRFIAEKTRCAHDPFEAIVTMATAVGRVEKILLGSDFTSGDRLFALKKFVDPSLTSSRFQNEFDVESNHFSSARPFYENGFYFLPIAGDDMLKSRAEHVVRNAKKFFQRPKGFIFAINSSQMRKFLIQSILHNIYGNLPLCSRLKRLSALAEKLLPVLQDEMMAQIWNGYHSDLGFDGAGNAYLQSDLAPTNQKFPEVEMGGQRWIWVFDGTEPLLTESFKSHVSPTAPRVPFITFDAVIDRLTQDINQILADPRVPVTKKQKEQVILKHGAVPFVISQIIIGILFYVMGYAAHDATSLSEFIKLFRIVSYPVLTTIFVLFSYEYGRVLLPGWSHGYELRPSAEDRRGRRRFLDDANDN